MHLVGLGKVQKRPFSKMNFVELGWISKMNFVGLGWISKIFTRVSGAQGKARVWRKLPIGRLQFGDF